MNPSIGDEPNEPRRIAHQNVVDELRDRILKGIYAHGERIRQEDIAEDFQLSRIPVREALRSLESEGLLIIEPHKGARVASVDPFELEQIYSLRAAVEPLAIRESAPRLSEEDLLELERLAERMESAKDIEDFLAADREFHLLTYQGVQFPLITKLVERFWNTTQHYRRRFAVERSVESFQLAFAEHRMLITALKTGNKEVASAIVKRHIERTRDDLMTMLQSKEIPDNR